jgi:hypothetical protein
MGNHHSVEATGNQVFRYMAILRAATSFGLDANEVSAIAGPFDPHRARCDELADALADLILARSRTGECSG